jgi:hypothetical protein
MGQRWAAVSSSARVRERAPKERGNGAIVLVYREGATFYCATTEKITPGQAHLGGKLGAGGQSCAKERFGGESSCTAEQYRSEQLQPESRCLLRCRTWADDVDRDVAA